MSAHGLWIGQVAMASLMNIAFACTLGAALLGAWLARDGLAAIAPARLAWLRAQRVMLSAAVVLVLADLGWLVYAAAAIGGVPLPKAFGAIPAVFSNAPLRSGWSVAFGGACVMLLAAFAARTGLLRHVLLGLAAIAVAAGEAALGPAGGGLRVSAAFGVLTVHLLASAVWGGLVIAAGLAVLPALGSSAARGVLIRTAVQMSNVSLPLAAIALASGAFIGLRDAGGSLAVLEASVRGHVLMLKLALVALVLLLGGLNRFAALSRLRRTASTLDAHTFANLLYLEALAMIGVFIVAATLAHRVAPVLLGG
jgi:putative copper resistance protein D